METPQKSQRFLRTPLLIAVSIFSLSMVLLWAFHAKEINGNVAIVGVSYALICFLFLFFQIYAFVRCHLIYDEDVENIKMKVFDAESRH